MSSPRSPTPSFAFSASPADAARLVFTPTPVPATSAAELRALSEALFAAGRQRDCVRTDRAFIGLLALQWLAVIAVSLTWSQLAWEGHRQVPPDPTRLALMLGGALFVVPVVAAVRAPGSSATRLLIGAAQMLWGSLLIHLTAGRIETHFHLFGSLAMLAFYRDLRVLGVATVVVALDQTVRGALWPESVFGVANPEWWRTGEHVFWVLFEDVFLALGIVGALQEQQAVTHKQAELEMLARRERHKSEQLDLAMGELARNARDRMARQEKLAAVGQLAASVGHELRNPLAAVKNGVTFLERRIRGPQGGALATDARVDQFLKVTHHELEACSRIISDLLDFARERPIQAAPTPIGALVQEAIGIVPPRPHVELRNEIDPQAPVPSVDRDQLRQVFINLIQNASEAMPEGRPGKVRITLSGGGASAWRIAVIDDGPGIPPDILKRIFEPLFTTKTKGTGLGLAVVEGVVRRHGGALRVESLEGVGTQFLLTLPDETGAMPSPAAAEPLQVQVG